ncbi:MAG: nitroreductase family protein [Chloroflexota bacterium]|nr:nitroreductase family protein [Chloroflexota bacterium]
MQHSPSATELIRSLRAVRRFDSRAIPASVLADILESARWTGSAKNTQPWHLVVVRDRLSLQRLSSCGRFASHVAGAAAATVLVMDGPRSSLDAGRLAQNIMLAAWAHGVGSCIGSIFEEGEARAKELLGIPSDRWVPLAISLGYPADESARRVSTDATWSSVLPQLGRKPLAELASWEEYGG